jgi:hypothetical protein
VNPVPAWKKENQQNTKPNTKETTKETKSNQGNKKSQMKQHPYNHKTKIKPRQEGKVGKKGLGGAASGGCSGSGLLLCSCC